jgi:uncharacterized membrane protein
MTMQPDTDTSIPFRCALVLHILSSMVALIIAPLAMITVKGGLWHRRRGKIYFWAMAGVALTATVMCFIRSGLFLFLIAIFSFYLALIGYIALRRKKPEDRPGWLDWCATIAMLAAGITLVTSGALDTNPDNKRWVRIIFGAIGLLLSGMDIKRFLKPSFNKRAWMFEYMTRFLAAYLATVTAFSVVNFQFLPYLWRWLWPTVLGVPVILIWRAYYQRQFNRERSVAT